MANETNENMANKEETNEPAERSSIIGEGTTKQPPGTADIGEDTPLTPERAAEGDRKKSDAV